MGGRVRADEKIELEGVTRMYRDRLRWVGKPIGQFNGGEDFAGQGRRPRNWEAFVERVRMFFVMGEDGGESVNNVFGWDGGGKRKVRGVRRLKRFKNWMLGNRVLVLDSWWRWGFPPSAGPNILNAVATPLLLYGIVQLTRA